MEKDKKKTVNVRMYRESYERLQKLTVERRQKGLPHLSLIVLLDEASKSLKLLK